MSPLEIIILHAKRVCQVFHTFIVYNSNMNFKENLKTALQNNGLSQAQLAEKLGTTQQTVSRWINGINEPDFTTLLEICKILNETPNSLLGLED